jgi:hypothetical protein
MLGEMLGENGNLTLSFPVLQSTPSSSAKAPENKVSNKKKFTEVYKIGKEVRSERSGGVHHPFPSS